MRLRVKVPFLECLNKPQAFYLDVLKSIHSKLPTKVVVQGIVLKVTPINLDKKG